MMMRVASVAAVVIATAVVIVLIMVGATLLLVLMVIVVALVAHGFGILADIASDPVRDVGGTRRRCRCRAACAKR